MTVSNWGHLCKNVCRQLQRHLMATGFTFWSASPDWIIKLMSNLGSTLLKCGRFSGVTFCLTVAIVTLWISMSCHKLFNCSNWHMHCPVRPKSHTFEKTLTLNECRWQFRMSSIVPPSGKRWQVILVSLRCIMSSVLQISLRLTQNTLASVPAHHMMICGYMSIGTFNMKQDLSEEGGFKGSASTYSEAHNRLL